jgi:predicted GTPase
MGNSTHKPPKVDNQTPKIKVMLLGGPGVGKSGKTQKINSKELLKSHLGLDPSTYDVISQEYFFITK